MSGFWFAVIAVFLGWGTWYGITQMENYVVPENIGAADSDSSAHTRDDSIVSATVFRGESIPDGEERLTEIPVVGAEKIYYASPLMEVKNAASGIKYVSQYVMFDFSGNGNVETYGKLAFFGSDLKQIGHSTKWIHIDSGNINSSLKRFVNGHRTVLSNFKTSVGDGEVVFGSYNDPKSGEAVSFAFISDKYGAKKFADEFYDIEKSVARTPNMAELKSYVGTGDSKLVLARQRIASQKNGGK